MPTHSPLRVLVAGGGVAALETVLALRALAGDKVELDLLAPSSEFVERPSSVLSPFSGHPAPRVPLGALADLGVRSHRGALASVDAVAHTVRTTDGGALGYDRLVVAPGARAIDGVPGAITFRGPISAGAVEAAVRRAHSHVIFVLPPGSGWPLPLYELALLTVHELPDGPAVTIVSPEPRPLDVFGRTASDALARLLDRAGITFMGGAKAAEALDIALVTADGRMLGADAVISLPRLVGPRIDGLPGDEHGFIEVDPHARVRGVPDVFAAGDATAGPIKQGGLAAQQADAAAEWIAAEAGAAVTPQPARRVLRGVVLTGEAPLYLRRDLDEDTALARPLRGAPPGVSRAGLWWPSGKIAGRYLTGFLAQGGTPGDRLSDRPPRKPRISSPYD
jgi:sulfide:quinone oxidoreductase